MSRLSRESRCRRAPSSPLKLCPGRLRSNSSHSLPTMVVRLRLARHGTRNNPFYHIVAIRDKAAREARPIEKLGEYDPIPRPRTTPTLSAASSSQRVLSSGLEEHKAVLEKRIEWNASRVQYWLSVGAQPSKPVAKLLDKVSACLGRGHAAGCSRRD